jgi:hypothetical protein
MNLRSFFTKERSRERTIFIATGTIFLALGVYHVIQENWGVAALLAGAGLAMVLAAWRCSERVLAAIIRAALVVNVIVAAVALIAGVKI